MAIDLGDSPVGTPPTSGEQTQILTALGGTTVGRALFQVTNPSAIRFPKVNADNSVTLRSDSDMRSDLGLAIGTNVQAYDADLSSWAGVTRASGFDTFAATPSSANLISLLTDETGTGSAVFATSPTMVTPNIGAATGTSLSVSGSLTTTGGNVVASGDHTFTAGAVRLRASAAGILLITNNGATDISRVQLGGTTSSYPAIKRNGTTMESRLADDSGYAPFAASNLTASGVIFLGTYTVATVPAATVRGFIYVSDETGGAVPAFADGTNWRRVTDRAIVS